MLKFLKIKREYNFCLLVIYVIFIYCYCVIFRKYTDADPLPLFWSYRVGWHSGNYFPFVQNNFANVILYVPVGFLLFGILSARNKEIVNKEKVKVWLNLLYCTIVGLCISLSVEIMQYYFHRGTFECDDLMNNTFGSLMGSSWFIMIAKKHSRKKFIFPTIFFLIVFAIMFLKVGWLVYQHKNR